MTRFNLVGQPWIGVTMNNGDRQTLSLKDVFTNAGSIRALDCGGDTQNLVVLRLLCAIWLRAATARYRQTAPPSATTPATPEPVALWRSIWEYEAYMAVDADPYLDAWRDRFDLFDPHHPFMQTPYLADELESRPVSALTLKATGIFMPTDTRETIPAPEAAIALLTIQAYDPAGIKPAARHDRRAWRGKLMPPPSLMSTGRPGTFAAYSLEADNLAHTILVNTPPLNTFSGKSHLVDDDLPAWERDTQTQEELGGTVTGMADELTVQSRRILLDHNGGQVTGVRITYGRIPERITDGEAEPMCAWSETNSGYSPSISSTARIELPLWADRQHLYGTSTAVRPMVWNWKRSLAPDMVMTVRQHCAQYRNAAALTTISTQHSHVSNWATAQQGDDALRAANRLALLYSLFLKRMDAALRTSTNAGQGYESSAYAMVDTIIGKALADPQQHDAKWDEVIATAVRHTKDAARSQAERSMGSKRGIERIPAILASFQSDANHLAVTWNPTPPRNK